MGKKGPLPLNTGLRPAQGLGLFKWSGSRSFFPNQPSASPEGSAGHRFVSARNRGIISTNFETTRKIPNVPRNITGTFYTAISNIGVISVRYDLPHCFVSVSSYVRLYYLVVLLVYTSYCYTATLPLAREWLTGIIFCWPVKSHLGVPRDMENYFRGCGY